MPKNKKYKELRQKQKAKIAEWMFHETCRFFSDNGRMPGKDETDVLAKTVYEKICSVAIWVPHEEVLREYIKKLPKYAERIHEHGVPDKKADNDIKKADVKEIKAVKKKRKKRRKKENPAEEIMQDDTFYYIAGYTSGGSPYGVTWEKMGLNPYEEIE